MMKMKMQKQVNAKIEMKVERSEASENETLYALVLIMTSSQRSQRNQVRC